MEAWEAQTAGKPTGFSIRIFLADGRPDGLRIVERSGWVGQALVCSRAQFPEVRAMQEYQRPGVYVLAGPDPDDEDRPRIYVGEADHVGSRISQHLAGKDWWTSAVVFTSRDENLNKAHIKHIESRLVRLSQEAKRAAVENGNVPQAPALSGPDSADAENFLANMLLVYPVLGIDAFHVAKRAEATAGSNQPTYGELIMTKRGVNARGMSRSDGFLVLEGATGRAAILESAGSWVGDLRRRLVKEGVMVEEGGGVRLVQDYLFKSPSAAAASLAGGNAAGPLMWIDAEGRTLKALESLVANSAG